MLIVNMDKYFIFKIRILLILGLISISGCEETKEDLVMLDAKNTSDESVNWSSIAGKRIFFGHQSVGNNIVDGIKLLIKGEPQADLKIVKLSEKIADSSTFIAHSEIGLNEDPLSKIKDFTRILDGGLGNNIDVAFMKFCYVDFKVDSKMGVSEVFNSYKKELSELKNKYPNTKFIHVTAPLRTVQEGMKAQVKKILGKPVAGYENNILRNEFNDLLRDEYSNKEAIFDLARIEATHPDGSFQQFTYNGETYFSLSPEYARDRGHLNDFGKKIIAEELLKLIENLI